ncbi:hypothetical protein RQN30_11340 [Arcanobacterium hippocoleae]
MLEYRCVEPSSIFHKIATKIHVILIRNASSRVVTFRLPRRHTVIIGGVIYL